MLSSYTNFLSNYKIELQKIMEILIIFLIIKTKNLLNFLLIRSHKVTYQNMIQNVVFNFFLIGFNYFVITVLIEFKMRNQLKFFES